MKKEFIRLMATGFYTGYSPLVPGTVGSVPAWLIAYFIIRGHTIALAIVTIATFAVSVWTATEAEKTLGRDARKIVIDEWAGMFLALVFVPYSPTNYVIAFVLFRALDVIKVPPARQSERLPGGWGVTIDDVVAGIQANVLTQLIVLVL